MVSEKLAPIGKSGMNEMSVQPEPPAETKTKQPFQFSIFSLMVVTAVVAGFFALGTQAPKEVVVITISVLAYLLIIFLHLRYNTRMSDEGDKKSTGPRWIMYICLLWLAFFLIYLNREGLYLLAWWLW